MWQNFNIHQCAQACYFFGSQCDGNPVCHWSSRQLNWSHPVDDYPPEVMNVPVMGDYTQPNIELLLTKKPDLIIGTISFRKETYDIMEKYWNVFIADPQSVSEVSSLIHRMGLIFQKEAQAKKLEEQIRLMPVALKSLGGQHPRVLLLMWHDPPMSVGKDTFINDVLNQVGLVSVTGSYTQPWPTLGEEHCSNSTQITSFIPRNPWVEKQLLSKADRGLT